VGPSFGKAPPHELYLRGEKNYKINVNKTKFESKSIEKYSNFGFFSSKI
jgi:hypothetical protein